MYQICIKYGSYNEKNNNKHTVQAEFNILICSYRLIYHFYKKLLAGNDI
jgi:hypothetical protein